jgi:hypothetical protein
VTSTQRAHTPARVHLHLDDRLLINEKNVNDRRAPFVQVGEDEILNEQSEKSAGTSVEVGGVTASSGYFFEKLGWRCLVVAASIDDMTTKLGNRYEGFHRACLPCS